MVKWLSQDPISGKNRIRKRTPAFGPSFPYIHWIRTQVSRLLLLYLCKETFTPWHCRPCLAARGVCETWANDEVPLPIHLPLSTIVLMEKVKAKTSEEKRVIHFSRLISGKAIPLKLNNNFFPTFPVWAVIEPSWLPQESASGQRAWVTGRDVRWALRAGNPIILPCQMSGVLQITGEALTDWVPLLQFECPRNKGMEWRWWRVSEFIEKADTLLWQEIGKNLVMLTSFSDVPQILELA